jgi:hypothetical protein
MEAEQSQVVTCPGNVTDTPKASHCAWQGTFDRQRCAGTLSHRRNQPFRTDFHWRLLVIAISEAMEDYDVHL